MATRPPFSSWILRFSAHARRSNATNAHHFQSSGMDWRTRDALDTTGGHIQMNQVQRMHAIFEIGE